VRRLVRVVSGGTGVLDEDVVALDVEEGVLGEVSSASLLVVVLVHEVGLKQGVNSPASE
jgi:hypothetical protein